MPGATALISWNSGASARSAAQKLRIAANRGFGLGGERLSIIARSSTGRSSVFGAPRRGANNLLHFLALSPRFLVDYLYPAWNRPVLNSTLPAFLEASHDSDAIPRLRCRDSRRHRKRAGARTTARQRRCREVGSAAGG